MADPPPIRRQATDPPPIPPLPIAPASAKTDVVPAPPGQAAGDATRNLVAPDAGILVERMLELVASEGEALLAGDDSNGRLADLNVRTALASWDALHQADEAMRFLELGDTHPLAPRLRLAAALVGGEVAALTSAEQRIAGATGALAIELAEAWLWRHGHAERAAAIAERVLAEELPPAWRAHVVELASLAHASLGNWPRLVELRVSALGPDTSLDEVAATAALMMDRAGNAAGALDTCWSKLAHFPSAGAPTLGWLRTFDIAITAAMITDDPRRFELLARRADLLAALPSGGVEALATRHAIATELEHHRDHGRALALWAQLAEDPAAQIAGGARRIAQLRAAWAAAGAGDRGAAFAAHRWLARDPNIACVEVVGTHAWRALELAAVAGAEAVGELARTVADLVASPAAERWLDVLDIEAPNAATIARFEARGGMFVRWAAAIAERRDAPAAEAVRLWQHAAAEPTLPTTYDHLVRLFRGGDEDALARAYAECARREPDPRCAAALWCARGIVDLARGAVVEAEESLRHAAELGPHDPFCRAALAAVYRAGKRHDLLAPILAELSGSLISPDGRAQAAREHAALLDEHPGERELAPAIAAAEATADPVARAQLFARVATLRAQRGDIDGALVAYTTAFAADPTNREVFTSMERVCFEAERWPAAMQLYEDAIVHVEREASRAYRLGDLYARRGNVQRSFLGQIDQAIASYQKAIEVDSQPGPAVQVLEELCTARGSWQPLIDAYEQRAEVQRDPVRKADALRAAAQLATEHAGDPSDALRLQRKLLEIVPLDAAATHALEKHYEASQDTRGLVDLLKQRLVHADGDAAAVKLLQRIARASEEGARDVDTATEHYHKILELQPSNRDALEALGRIYESTEQWAAFIDLTRKQIKVTNDRNIKALLYFRCGSVMEAKFGREPDAIRYYEAAIKTAAACLPAVHGLRDLYRRREEWPRVIETLELEVTLWQDDKERAGVLAQIGRVHEKQLGDAPLANQFYERALAVDPDCLPANQALFERHFEQREWDKARAIANVLAQKAMRDGDPTTRSAFYRRRGVAARMTDDPRAAAESFIVALELKPTNTEALDDLGALARARPDAWEFDVTYRELEKVYKKRDDAGALLARVHVGRAAILEREGDLDQAAELYRQALELAPADFTVLTSLVDFHAGMRHWSQAIAAIERFVNEGSAAPQDRVAARMCQATIHADGEMEPARAIAVLRDLITGEPSHQEAYHLLAQQHYLLGDHAEARAAIDRVIELATAPGQPLSPAALARYYYYKGRILDAAGDGRSATSQYRRAIEYDPAYAPPALVLARRAADGGEQRQAVALLIEAAHAAMAQGGPHAAVPLQRGLARILLASGDRPAAIEAYRGILSIEPDSPSDRVALAEIYAVDVPARAIGELRKVLERDIHHAPAYRMLASFHTRTGDVERAHRVLTALELLGFAEETDRLDAQRLSAGRATVPLRAPLDDDHRDRLLLPPSARTPLGAVFDAFAAKLTARLLPPSLGENLRPAHVSESGLIQLAAEVGFLYRTDVEIFIGEKVPGLAAVTAFPRRLLVLDRSLLAESELVLRFLLGYAFDAIRGGYATLLQAGARQRRELEAQLRALLAGNHELTGPAAELLDGATAQQQQMLEDHRGIDVDAGPWIDGMLACAKRAGLVACDDFAAAIWGVARLSGEQLENHDATVALGSVLGGPDLVRYYLSDDYQQLRDVLTERF